ncbi:MAG: peptide chain release factor 3 [Chthoniobacter sp.]|jgi:peptide chain release factor 3|nr:peptide chain release factor 3 [Chthoniobacter sp.]
MLEEIQRRRTFAIISHPDAGKTTLTEKLLLYGGAVQLAGSVTARKNARAATSDWMELERKRGISVSSTVLQFEYRGYRVNLLDTPGHKDFSEDTYRVLTAVDAVVMVIDAGKGIEAQTRKLFEVCRRRGVPIFTFMNKCDRPTREPVALLDELEHVLGIGAFAVNWPLGAGVTFRGVFSRQTREVHLFERTAHGAYRAPVQVGSLDEPFVTERVEPDDLARAIEELEMLEIAGVDYCAEKVNRGEQTPVFFGSAMNNFGVQLLLDAFLERSLPPQPRRSMANGKAVKSAPASTPAIDHGAPFTVPLDGPFSGFIFKIQANMDPRHRDRIAFLRICSGRFTRDMTVTHSRTGKRVRLSSAHKVFAQERETVDEAFAGDVIGLVGHSEFGIGDTLSEDGAIEFREIPRFPPECFAYLHNPNPSKFKQFRQGVEQLLQEGVVQVFELRDAAQKLPLLAAVGPLQFEVVQFRLESEYGAKSQLENASWEAFRWLKPDTDTKALKFPTGCRLAFDSVGDPGVLFPSAWTQRYFGEQNPGVALLDLPAEAP